MAKIRLGDRDFELKPLRLGQLRDVLNITAEAPNAAGGSIVETAARIIATALSRDHPDMTFDGIINSVASLEQVNEAVAVILKEAGLAPSGEAEAPAAE